MNLGGIWQSYAKWTLDKNVYDGTFYLQLPTGQFFIIMLLTLMMS